MRESKLHWPDDKTMGWGDYWPDFHLCGAELTDTNYAETKGEVTCHWCKLRLAGPPKRKHKLHWADRASMAEDELMPSYYFCGMEIDKGFPAKTRAEVDCLWCKREMARRSEAKRE